MHALEGKIRELNSKAESIDDAVYDLKAVNPNAKTEEDTRTPEQLLDFIEAKGREIQAAINALRSANFQQLSGSQDSDTSDLSLSLNDIKSEEHQRASDVGQLS